MPGIFGAFCDSYEMYGKLEEYFRKIFGNCDIKYYKKGFMGGHAYNAKALYYAQDNVQFVIDGEFSFYRYAAGYAEKHSPILFNISNHSVTLTEYCKGNIVIYDNKADILYIAADDVGGFPLYYSISKDKILFSSHLKPLSKLIQASPDYIGIIEYLRHGYTVNGRSIFNDIKRVLPGQAIICDLKNKRFKLEENSKAWVGGIDALRAEDIILEAREISRRSAKRCVSSDFKFGLMLSAGWDSRYLLSILSDEINSYNLICYSHGNPDNREMRLAHKLANIDGCHHIIEPLSEKLFDLEFINTAFQKVENISFPHFHHAGKVLREKGVSCATAGVFGEVLGGKYGFDMLLNLKEKAIYMLLLIISEATGLNTVKYTMTSVKEMILIKSLKKPWYLNLSFWKEQDDIRETMNSDIEADIKRLEKRGVAEPIKIIEAFITEHRAANYIMAQLLSCRSFIDITNVYGDKELYNFASKVSFNRKRHDTLTKLILKETGTKYLGIPTASVLTPASYPIFLQELTRVLRKLLELLLWKLYYKTKGKIAYVPFDWPNFEFLRRSKSIDYIVDDINNRIFDKDRIIDFVKKEKETKYSIPMHSISDQLLKIYFIDKMLK